MTLPARAALAALALASLSACAKVQARTPVPPPALVTPTPPARMVVPAPPLEPIAEPAPATTTPNTPAPAKPNPPPTRTPERSSPPPTPQTPPPPDSPPPVSVLQTTLNAAELETQARNFIDQAQKNLAKLNPLTLGREPRDQYDAARRFVDLALKQIELKNFVRARQYAENAAAMAGQLVK
jgi:hypothetical protein